MKYSGPAEQDFSEDDGLIMFLICKSEDHCRFSKITLLIGHWISYGGCYMAAWRYEILLLVLKNISNLLFDPSGSTRAIP